MRQKQTAGNTYLALERLTICYREAHKLLANKENKRIQQVGLFLKEKTPALFHGMERYKQMKEQERYAN